MPKEHFYYGNIHLALDSHNGEILAIRNLVTGDYLIKNAMCCDPETYVYQPFTFKLSDGESETEYHPLYSREPQNVLMRPPQFAAKEEIVATCFANDTYLWLYHIGEDINYFRDERGLELIKKVNRLNSIKKQNYSDFVYVDTDGLCCDERVARVRRYNKGNQVLLKAYRYKQCDVTVSLFETIKKATAITWENEKLDLEISQNSFQLPAEKISLILLETE